MIIHQIEKEKLIDYLKEDGYYCERDIGSAIFFSSLKNKKEIERPEFVLDTLGRILIFQFKYVVVKELRDSYNIVYGDSNLMQYNIQKFNKLYSLSNWENMKNYISFITLDGDASQFPKIRAIFHEDFYC